ncbi:hypothetical protein [Burkholderia metallica]|uniref:hypothetical protein n=1 Tax=Burkholderia metallica TaxID=488729 RepID=UPI0020C68CC4|nr:hypothetical protein [Burkholderia metallica]
MTGFRAFSSVCANADTFYYGLQAVTGTGAPSGSWEIGIGTYNASGNTLSRNTVLASSNGGAVVNLAAGTTQVWMDLPAALPANLPVSAKYFGAKGNTRIVNDGVTTSGSTSFSSASATFTAADVGKRIDIATTNASGVATLVVSTTIAAFVSATQVTLAKAANASATGANVVYGSDDGPALTAWLNYLMTIWPVKGDLPAGVYYSSLALPPITKPIAVFGHSTRTSIIQFGAGVSGQCLTVLNAGFNNEATDLPQTGNVSWTSNMAVLARCVLRDFTLQGNRACASLQHGLVLQGNVDWLDVAHVNCLYFRGGGVLWMDTGSGSTQARANVREVNLNTMKIRHCGDLSIFMPVNAVNGTGDTTLATIFGITGTITRSGSVTAGTDTYTFTPSSSSTAYIPAGEYFSKICVDASQGNGVAGRYKYIPEDRYGRAVNGAWASGRLLQMWPWQFHIENATGLVRYSYGAPTADSAGNAMALWSNGFVGTSSTPSVTSISKLTANYASPTTLTNLVGGIDGQTVKIVATNGNCTIANNANIQTTTGGNVVMASGQVLTFTFDATLNKWCGG